MIHFGQISKEEFLKEYWQKKPLLLKNAIPGFASPLAPDELAGLSCEEEFESRVIKGSTKQNNWSLENGPFDDLFYQIPLKMNGHFSFRVLTNIFMKSMK